MKRIRWILLCLAVALFSLPVQAAEVRFGKNVRVGGHDFSNQTFNEKRRARVYIYENKPKAQGCVWRKDKNGVRTKVCHLQRKVRKK